VLWVDNAAVVSAPAEIDVVNAGDVLGCLLTVIREGPAVLIVDLTATTFCDSAAVHTLVHAFKQARASGVELRLALGGPAVSRLLEITGVNQLIGTYPTVPESLIGRPPPEAQPTSRSLTLRFCDAERSSENARACPHRSWAMITPIA
jgi:anti-sigma B factor antagonist